MAGTITGGKKAAAKNIQKDPNFYQKIGRIGGKNGRTGGFATKNDCNCREFPYTHTIPMCAGKKGGRISRRTKKVDNTYVSGTNLVHTEV